MRILCLLAILISVCALRLHANCINYFVFASEKHKDSFVVPMRKAEDIEAARQMIRNEYSGPFGFRVTLKNGANGINRDYQRTGAPLWSWHIEEFLGFGGGGSADTVEFYASYLEHRGVERYLQVLSEWNQDVAVSWLDYVAVMELAPMLCLAYRIQNDDLILEWPSQGYPVEYIVEATNDIAAGNWRPLPGMPILETGFRVQPGQFQYYRVLSRFRIRGYPD